ncbi:MAG: Ig domain-containing protein, partial [Christensenellales bacterium]
MKKFIVYLLVIICCVSLGFAVFYLVRDNEVISISSASIYKDVGDKFTLDINHINKKASTTISITSSDDSIVSGKYDANNGEYTAEAKKGGVARINVRTTNAKFRNLWCDVIVGDGTVESPFYISTAEQLASIGMGAEIFTTGEDGSTIASGVYAGAGNYEKYASNLCYKLIANIDASTVNQGYWVPLRNFNGRLDGNGFTISNIYIDAEGYKEALGDKADAIFNSNKPAGLFESIGENGIVYNLKLDNFKAVGTYSEFGTITARNKGTIERVEVKNAYTSIITSVFGGIVGTNSTTETLVEKTDEQGNPVATYVRNVARVDRCSVILTHGQKSNNDGSLDILGATGTIGGIVGINNGGTIVYSYVRGNIYFGDDSVSAITFGGIVGMNRVVSGLHYNASIEDESQFQGANIKDCYSDLRTNFLATPNSNSKIAGAVAVNEDSKNGIFDESDNRVNNYLIGIYYNKDNLNYKQEGITKAFTGIAEFTLDGSKVTFTDTITIVYGLTAEEMLNPEKYISHTTKSVEFNSDGTSKGIVEKNILWFFDTVWVIDADTNDGMPYLNYQLIYIPDDFGTVGVPVVPSDLVGYYYKIEIDYPVSIISGVDGKLRIKVNEYYQLVYSPTGLDITWTSSNSSVVSVDENGKLQGLKAGVATVTAKTKTGSTDTITVIVENIPYVINNLPETIYLYVADTFDLSEIEVVPTPSGSDTISYSLKTTDGKVTDIASISGTTLTAIKAGNAVLYVSIADTKVSANVIISTRPEVTLTASPRTVSGYFEDMSKTGSITITNSQSADLTYTYSFKSGAGLVNLGFSSTNKNILNYEIVGTGNAVVNISITNTGYSGNLDIYFNIKSETSVELTLSSATITGYYEDIKKTGSVTISNSANASLS